MAGTCLDPISREILHGIGEQIKADTEAALRMALENKGVLSVFQTFEDLGKQGLLSVFQVPNSIEADYSLDGELILMRRVIDGEIVYFGQDSVH